MNIPLDDPRFQAAGLHVVANGAVAAIHDLDESGAPKAQWHTCVVISGSELSFYPIRSAAQRKTLARIGIMVPEPTAS